MIKKLQDMKVVADSVPQFYNIQSGLYKHKSKTIPPLPKSRHDIKLKDEWVLCEDGQRRFLVEQDQEELEMIIFCSDIGLKILAESIRWNADGTFTCPPPEFEQLYLIHGLYKSILIPVGFILLTGKSELLYKKMLRELKDAALNIGLELKPQELVIDFEKAVMNAFKFHWPNIRIIGCFFHLASNFYKKVCNVGLKTQYDEDEKIKTWVKKVTCLALVPIDKVEELFEELCIQKSYWFDTPEYAKIDEFADYVLENYIETNLFPIEVWNQYNNDGSRTNNSAVGYNHKLNNFLNIHPNIWLFIRKIQAEESTAALTFNRINDGTLNRRGRNRVDIQMDLQIQKLKCEYLSQNISAMEYLEKVSEYGPKFGEERKNKKKK